MPQFDEKHVKICGCYVVWDGITRPDTGPDNKPKYSLKVVADPVDPSVETALIDPTTEVVDFIPGLRTRPQFYRILCTERMA